MDEFQETFTNPFNIKCSSCGSPAEYDIIHQNYHCQHCGSVTELEAPRRAVERYRQHHEQELKAKKTSDRLRKYNCPGCGAIVVLDATEATGKCDFCGTKMVNSDFLESDAFPELIIPFKITLDEAKGELEKWLKENASKEEAKLLQNRVNELQGYYLPYQIVKGPVKGTALRARSFRKYTYGGFVDEVAVNTSKQLDNLLLDAMEPFDWREIHPFEYGFIAGMRTKMQDSSEKGIEARIREEIRETYLPTVEKTLQSADLDTHVDVSEVMQIPALMPVYIITRGKVQCAINGQTGRVAVTPIKEKVVQRNWLEPVLTWLFVAALCESVPLFFNFHPSYEITMGLSIIVVLIVWAAYTGAIETIKKVVYWQSPKQLAIRDAISKKLRFTDGKELMDNPAKIPVFFEMLEGKLEPVKVSFYTSPRIFKAAIFALGTAFLPNILAYAVVAYDVYLYNDPVERFNQIHHFYAAAWWTLMIPILFVLWIAIVRRDVFDYPILYRIQPDGSTVKVANQYQVDFGIKDMFTMLIAPPVCWVTLFVLFMILGCVGAMVD